MFLIASAFNSMNPMIPYASTFGIISILIYASVNKQSIAKVMATFTLVFVLITFSSASTEWNQYTNGLVDDVDDPHYGLPDSWDDKQAVCFHFPEGYTPSNLDDGRHHFDSNGTDFKIDKNWNSTGGCVGGFEGYDYGLNLFNAAVEATNSTFSYNYTQFYFGLQIDSIAGISPCAAYTCATDSSSGAYWEMLHNGAYSLVGISYLILDSNSVITWQITSY
jgi:hypothetical protein